MREIYFIVAFLALSNMALAQEVAKYEVVAKKIDDARNRLSPRTGSSSYSFSQENIENLPLGQSSSFNQVLLRAPSVTQDSYGQVHIRGDHSNIQYRINNVIMPEGIGGFGQMMDTRLIENFDLITGALPAQYGQRTGGVVDIKTKSGAFKKGTRAEIITGSHDTISAAGEVRGSQNRLNYYINASHLQNNRGIENPTSRRDAPHNDTSQNKFFGYFSYLLDNETKLTLMLVNADSKFQLPNNPQESAVYSLTGVQNVSPIGLKQKQKETNQYVIAALQGVVGDEIDYQISAFTRYSKVNYDSDFVGDLVFNGVASDVDRSSVAAGLQGDFSYELNAKNILRAGFTFANEGVASKNRNAVFAINEDGGQASTDPMVISESKKKYSQNYGLYLQDEYKAAKKLILNYGARFDAINSYVNEHQFSPRFGVVYNLNNKTKLHFGYARYFTPPANELISSSAIALYQGTTNQAQTLQNDPVRSERTNYYDIGIKHELSDSVNIGFDSYLKDIKNVLDRGQFGQTLIYSPFNFAKGRAHGVEFTGDYKKDNFSAYLNAAYQKILATNIISSQYLHEADELEFLQNNYGNLDHVQQITAAAGVSYKQNKTLYTADMLYGGGLRHGFANSNRIRYYTITNVGISQEFNAPMLNKFNARFTILNLFDKNYMLRDGSGIGVNSAQYGLRRSYYVSVSKEF